MLESVTLANGDSGLKLTNNNDLLEFYVNNGTKYYAISYNGAVIVVPIAGGVLEDTITTQTYYYHNDHLGSPQVLTDANKTVVWRGDYSPFGEVTASVNAVEQNLRFPGQYYDRETGLYYNTLGIMIRVWVGMWRVILLG